jgi:hypothetical protein
MTAQRTSSIPTSTRETPPPPPIPINEAEALAEPELAERLTILEGAAGDRFNALEARVEALELVVRGEDDPAITYAKRTAERLGGGRRVRPEEQAVAVPSKGGDLAGELAEVRAALDVAREELAAGLADAQALGWRGEESFRQWALARIKRPRGRPPGSKTRKDKTGAGRGSKARRW